MSNRLKILWISHLIPYPPKGGVLMRSNYLITELAKNHDVHLVALNQTKLLEAYYASAQEGLEAARAALGQHFGKLRFFDFKAASSGRNRQSLAIKSLFSEFPYSVAWLACDDLSQAISDCLAAEDYDLVHFDTVGLAQYRGLVGDIPTILDHHNIESHMMLRRAEKEPNLLKKMYFYQEGLRLRGYEKKVLDLFDGHIVCSGVDRERLISMQDAIDAKVIPNAVRMDANFTPKQNDSGPAKLLFIGGLDWYPNKDAILHFCAEVWPRIITQNPEVRLDIVGKNPCPEILAYADRDDRIKVHGFVDDITELYAQSDVFICPIRDGGGTKLKVLDAMAHSLPVVGYSEACEGIDVEPGRDAIVVQSSQEFAGEVLALVADRSKARAIGNAAQQLIEERYEAQKVGQALSDYYLEVAGRS